jgi:hypothetical protein
MQKFNNDHASLLYARFCAIYGDKFYKAYHDEDFKKIWVHEWVSALSNIDVALIKGVLDYCKSSIEWPPSIAEFLRICEKHSGIPQMEEALSLAIRREFNHPIIFMAYEKIGNWAMKHSKEDVLREKFKEAYENALNDFRSSPDSSWEKLKSLPVETVKQIDYKSTEKERTQFKANWKNWREEADRIKQSAKAPHPIWEKGKITMRHPDFDQVTFDERKKYLMGLTEKEAMTLDSADWYDRSVFFREIEAQKHLAKVRGESGFNRNSEQHRPNHYRSSESKHVYKDWIK